MPSTLNRPLVRHPPGTRALPLNFFRQPSFAVLRRQYPCCGQVASKCASQPRCRRDRRNCFVHNPSGILHQAAGPTLRPWSLSRHLLQTPESGGQGHPPPLLARPDRMFPQMSSPNPRKRTAPGASPIVPIPINTMQQPQFAAPQPDQFLKWNGAGAEGAMYADAAARNVNHPYMMPAGAGQFSQGIPQAMPATPSTALARRGMGSRALVPTAPRQVFDPSAESWNFGDDFQQQQQQQPQGNAEDNESIEALEERALRAKREAMGKRKQIPPFVQKLSR